MRSCRFYLYIHKLIEDNEKHLIRYSNGALTTMTAAKIPESVRRRVEGGSTAPSASSGLLRIARTSILRLRFSGMTRIFCVIPFHLTVPECLTSLPNPTNRPESPTKHASSKEECLTPLMAAWA